ncbi:TNFAIP3-interacting protein 1 [Chiloscyllium plagiosum]|uniref:TNFAIP3-interacting protein 1 n=1 Tax=Chiloscyllium plagiosum TaxID=36176 RepID=UPI001CB7BE5D|nr:TNFAIP3-interacting protein 1 [Chiloscyllium plagiosum]
MMDGQVPYRIYDPGGSSRLRMSDVSSEPEVIDSISYQQLVEENQVLKERMKGLRSLGNLLEESQAEALKLRQKVEELARQDSLKSTSLSAQEINGPALTSDAQASGHQHQSESDKRGTLVEEAKAEVKASSSGSSSEFEVVSAEDKKDTSGEQAEVSDSGISLPIFSRDWGLFVSRASAPVGSVWALIAVCFEFQLLEVNKQWDQQFRSMKQQYEQKIVELRQRLARSQKELSERENGYEEKQRDFDRKLLLAKSKIESGESEKERCLAEMKELKQRNQCLQNQLLPLTKQREYQEKEIQRLNKALGEALAAQPSSPQPVLFSNTSDSCMSARRTELLTQIEVLKQQVKIFEEDFQRERSDRERMNEEKEELRQKLEKVQTQMTLLNTQLRIYQEDYQKEKLEKEKIQRLLKHQKQVAGDRRPSDPPAGAPGPYCPPPYQIQYPPLPHPTAGFGGYDWQIHYPPAGPGAHAQFRGSEFPWNAAFPAARSPHAAGTDRPKADGKEPTSPRLGKGQH